MHTIEKGRKKGWEKGTQGLRELTHKLVDGNRESTCNVPSNLLGIHVSILKEDTRLGLVTVQGYNMDTGYVFIDEFNSDCVEII